MPATNLSKIYWKFLVFLALLAHVHSDAVGTLIFAGCDKNGWKCISSKVKSDKYDLEFDCNGTSSTSISLWNFRAPKEIFGLKISNCGYLEVDLSCGNDGQPIDSLYIYNIQHLNLTSPVHSELSFLPNKLVLDTIGRIEKIPTNLFKQNMDFPLQLFKCSTQGMPINTLFFTDIGHIDLIEHHAINLTDMSWFTWNNVSINEIEPMAMQVFMEKDKQFTIKQSQIGKIGYKGIVLRAHSIFFNQTDIHEIEKYGISATVYWFDFTNSKIGTVQAKALHLLAQNVNIMNNSFSQLEPRALNGIGPGLLENALVSFGHLRFTYVFSRNRILQANVGSLNPDWEAYKNVKTFLNFTLNHLPCSCSELGWVNLADGLGSGLLDSVSFSTSIMEKKSQNMCVDAPCLLPLGVMSVMHFVNGCCQKANSLKEVCYKFINNKDFRMKILTESTSDKCGIRNQVHGGMDQNNGNLVDTRISDHPFPIVPVKSNIIEKKTEYLNFREGEPHDFQENLKSLGLKRKRSLPRRFMDLKKNVSSMENFVEDGSGSKGTPKLTLANPKPKIEKLGAYKVDWQLLKVAKNQKNQDGIVYIPKIIQEPTGVVEYYLVSEPSREEKENSAIPITIRPFKGDRFEKEGPKASERSGKASIHEQISSIAEKLTKDIEQQVQERQMLEQEEELESSNASDELRLQELYDSKEYDPEIYERELRESRKREEVTEKNEEFPVQDVVKRKLDKVQFIRKKIVGEGAGSSQKTEAAAAAAAAAKNDIVKETPEMDWDPIKESEESNDSSIYKELVQVKQKLEKQYNNQTFPIKLVRKTRI